MVREDQFAYTCYQCGRCCRDQVITLSPYDVIRIARAAGLTTGEVVRRYTIRRGSLLKFTDQRTCVALEGARCTVHHGRPLACRLYPLGLQRDTSNAETFIQLEPAAGSRGVYGLDGSVAGFLKTQAVDDYLQGVASYRPLLPLIRTRITDLTDFEVIEPREFWRCAVREALAETRYDANPLIDALFDADSVTSADNSVEDIVSAHVRVLEARISAASEPCGLAAAGVLLAVSLGYPPFAAAAEGYA